MVHPSFLFAKHYLIPSTFVTTPRPSWPKEISPGPVLVFGNERREKQAFKETFWFAVCTSIQLEMAHITSTVQPTKGFHPVSMSTLHVPHRNPYWDLCSLHLHYILPPLLFVDTHELAQRNASYTFRHWGSRDLEKPTHALPDEHSELLVNLNLQEALVGSDGEAERILLVEVPMHLRYAAPKAHTTRTRPEAGPYEQIQIDLPHVFFRCPASCKVLFITVQQASLLIN